MPARDRGARAHGLRCAARPLARARDKPAGWDATGRLRRSEGEGAILTGARRAARDRASTSREETRLAGLARDRDGDRARAASEAGLRGASVHGTCTYASAP